MIDHAVLLVGYGDRESFDVSCSLMKVTVLHDMFEPKFQVMESHSGPSRTAGEKITESR